MIESARVEQWLYELLAGDSDLANLVGNRIYSYVSPETVSFPFVVFSHQASHDVRGVGPARIMASFVYQVKAVDRGPSFANVKAIADRLDSLLQGASGDVVDGQVLMCVRENQVAYVEVDSGIQYRHLGGLYRIVAQEI